MAETETEAGMANPGASADAIQYHYDVGNEFYRLWLDPTLTYSGALWEDGEGTADLEKAQWRKIDFHIDQARAQGADRVLDVGCGWGTMARRLVGHHGVRQVVGLTLSQAQADVVRAIGDPRIEVRLESWTDYAPDQPFDAIVSIGAFEHFAKLDLTEAERIAGYRAFFQRCHEWLKKGGRLSLQTIAYGDLRRGKIYDDPFIATEIFPESDLPKLHEIAAAADGVLEVVQVRNDREHYARTSRAWFDNLRANRERAVELVGEDVVQRYERFHRTFSYSFELGAFYLYRITFRRIDSYRR
jgi:cyclopropane-fatty-acyl-phospholipid synthase